MTRLNNKVALITGSARGIGQAIGELFHKEGATVIFSDINDNAGKHVVANFNLRAEYYHLDVKNDKDWQNTLNSIKTKYGKLDILVNNAGIGGFIETQSVQDVENIPYESWKEVHLTNLDGVFLGCQHVIKIMKNCGGGNIVNISSRAGIVGIPAMSAYASSKAAVRNHTKSVALYCAQNKLNIRCNSIHPGSILTKLWDPIIGTGSDREINIKQIERGIPMGKMGSPEDVAYAALYLASDEAKYVTGSELIVDGGILAGSEASPGD